MKTMSIALALVFMSGIWSNFALGSSCRILGCESCSIDIEELDHNQTIRISGSELPTHKASILSRSLYYDGPADGGFLSYGPYYSQRGSKVIVQPSLYISTEWSPDIYHTCKKRNWKKKCISWEVHNHETGFTVDYMVDGEVIYSKGEVNRNAMNEDLIFLPPLQCNGDLNELEVRVHSAYGGSVKFFIHELRLSTLWQD